MTKHGGALEVRPEIADSYGFALAAAPSMQALRRMQLRTSKIFRELALFQELVVTHESEGVQFMRAFPEPSEELQPIDNCCVQKSVLVKPPLCNLNSEGFGNTPCQ